jgi:SecD/SecF fusion protein
MKSNIRLRLAVVAAVTLIALLVVFPTFHYFLAVSGRIPATPEQLEALRKRSVPLGLDLQGGVDVLLAIDEQKTAEQKVNAYAEDIRNRFRQESPSIDAVVDVTTETPQIIVTLGKAEQERSADNILTSLKALFPSYRPGEIKAGVALTLTPDAQLLSQNIAETVDSALKVIRDRVNTLGVTQPMVAKQGSSRIRVQIPGEKDPEEVIRNIIRPAQLEFRGVKTADVPGADGRYEEDSGSIIDLQTGKPLEGKTIPPGYEVRTLREQRVDPSTGQLTTNERKILVRTKVEMTGDSLQDAWLSINQASFESPVQVHLEFKPEGARRFAQVTEQYLHKPLAILLDGVVYSFPNVQAVIETGQAVITGGFKPEEGRNLSLILKAGALPAAMAPIEKRTVEATLGADSIKSSVFALAVGSVIVAVLMMGYYGIAGVAAILAVLINVLLVFAFMKLANATLTLSGIGGVLLTVGMAVDANVLIYERIREEMRSGKTLKNAIALGFNRAFTVIFDANLTTLIAGLTLLQFGEGSVKGFALALNVGILATLFTGLFVTHALIDGWYLLSGKLNVGFFSWFRPTFYLDFIKLRGISYTLSGILFLASLVYILPIHGTPSIHWGVDFSGGLLTEVQTTENLNTQQVQGGFQDWKVQKVAGENRFIIRSKFVDDSPEQIARTQQLVESHLNSTVGAGKYQILGSEAVGNEVGREFTFMAILACLIASVGILIYMAFRFQFDYGVAAVIALFHDLIIAFGIFNMLSSAGLSGEVTLEVVSALLVILGYSVNDTIIIFDRVRENVKLHPGMPFRDLVNRSICESLNRTVMTVSTTLITLVTMLLIGGAGLYDFALVLLIGIIKGTYSSSFIAAPLLVALHEYRRKRREARGGAQVVAPLIKGRA